MTPPSHIDSINATSCLVQGVKIEKLGFFNSLFSFNKDLLQATPILERIVRRAVRENATDVIVKRVYQSWTLLPFEAEQGFIEKQFGADGTELLSICGGHQSRVYYLILSSILNAQKRQEDIKLYTYEQVMTFLTRNQPFSFSSYEAQEMVLCVKFLLEQDLMHLARLIWESTVAEPADTSAYDLTEIDMADAYAMHIAACARDSGFTPKGIPGETPPCPVFRQCESFKNSELNMYPYILEELRDNAQKKGRWMKRCAVLLGLSVLLILLKIFYL